MYISLNNNAKLGNRFKEFLDISRAFSVNNFRVFVRKPSFATLIAVIT